MSWQDITSILFVAMIFCFAVCLAEYLFRLIFYTLKNIKANVKQNSAVISGFRLIPRDKQNRSSDAPLCIHLFILALLWIVIDYAVLDGSRRLILPILITPLYFLSIIVLRRCIYTVLRPLELTAAAVVIMILKSTKKLKGVIITFLENKKIG